MEWSRLCAAWAPVGLDRLQPLANQFVAQFIGSVGSAFLIVLADGVDVCSFHNQPLSVIREANCASTYSCEISEQNGSRYITQSRR